MSILVWLGIYVGAMVVTDIIFVVISFIILAWNACSECDRYFKCLDDDDALADVMEADLNVAFAHAKGHPMTNFKCADINAILEWVLWPVTLVRFQVSYYKGKKWKKSYFERYYVESN